MDQAPGPVPDGFHSWLDYWMEIRRSELRKSWDEVMDEAGISSRTTLWNQRRTNGAKMVPATRIGLERALEWMPGGVESARRGVEPARRPRTRGGEQPLQRHDPMTYADPTRTQAFDVVEQLREIIDAEGVKVAMAWLYYVLPMRERNLQGLTQAADSGQQAG